MSLILDALKKLERDKGAGDAGVVVVTSVPWNGVEPKRHRRLLWLLLAVVAGATVAAWRLLAPVLPAGSRPRADAVGAAPALTPSPIPATAVDAEPQAEPVREAAPALVAPPAARRVQLPDAPAEVPPARAATAPTPAPDAVQLMAISQRDGRPVAIINDRLLYEGDSFDGVRVLQIGETSVEVEVRGRRRVLGF
jgi:hypothetical protein